MGGNENARNSLRAFPVSDSTCALVLNGFSRAIEKGFCRIEGNPYPGWDKVFQESATEITVACLDHVAHLLDAGQMANKEEDNGQAQAAEEQKTAG